MKALELFNDGSLAEAIASATDSVKKEPTNLGARLVLAELLCFSGNFERADKQAETIVLQDPKSGLVGSLIRQLVRAELARRECFTQGRSPEFLGEPDQGLQDHVRLLLLMREGDKAAAGELAAKLEEERTIVGGTCNGTSFADFRDLDDTCSRFFEVLTSTGKYYWVPFSRIESVTFEPVQRPRDLLWRQARMIVENGPDGVVYIPTLYGRTDNSMSEGLQLGRETDWVGDEGEPVYGIGQRIFSVNDVEVTAMELETLEFNVASS